MSSAWTIWSSASNPARERTACCRCLTAELQVVQADDIDGELFKKFTHGLDCSLKRLFDRYIGQVRPRATALDSAQGTTIAYGCVDHGYRFQHSAEAPYVQAEVYDLFADHPEETAAAA